MPDHAIIAEGSIIKAKTIRHSVIGIRSRIGKGTVIDQCYIMGSDYYQHMEDIKTNYEKGILPIGIGDNCLQNVIVDKDCRIGNGGFYHRRHSSRSM